MALVWMRTPRGHQVAQLPDGQMFIISWSSVGRIWFLFHTDTDGVERMAIPSSSGDLREAKEYAEDHLKRGCSPLPMKKQHTFRYCLENDYKEDA